MALHAVVMVLNVVCAVSGPVGLGQTASAAIRARISDDSSTGIGVDITAKVVA
jgi:hypothetical protein